MSVLTIQFLNKIQGIKTYLVKENLKITILNHNPLCQKIILHNNLNSKKKEMVRKKTIIYNNQKRKKKINKNNFNKIKNNNLKIN